ncbi:oxidoreductase [candidate division WOR-1 bacterium RIFOXYA12_FULL_43_27]|uniref:Oxidoreductase n=1 Tax=candidate division WOR-1 bacterium RIFOXYC2_FULL_46_14 TaxID=1802587 RepID=A0A1F4U5U7_UNCSA|nr:MAG: oxidoreductase [candidate division WOR-1 bacterium RIFOXYA12_FULL_43_27]OGC20344.1 MAG: oxidoreductase [candidate division WOR-1 bacterium RIFOXYB2_FULL_46_45]OGC31919.1 MAG: oxidoreductase [candidate division WOR-1 bacterium RIFOXYA2_FULL_46_56]OGC40190.1 MAG: oxidoreductase [candidate division WOR-1 bacterium RIFOXYC2_FULL_46_14]
MKKLLLKDSKYEIKKSKIIKVTTLTDLEKFFEIELPGGDSLDHDPGQFVEVSILGVGEAPISVSSSPTKLGSFEMVVRKVGRFTSALHQLKEGDEIGIRGPFGKGFPVRILEGNDLVFVAAGLGIVPLRSLINFVIDNRRDFGKVSILLGCRTPQNMLFGDEVAEWTKRLDVNFSCTVDRADPDWKGNVGMITSLIPGVTLEPERTFAVIVGPPVMYKFVIAELLKKQIPERQILVSLERNMKCGLGKCGHCQINGLYCCQDGPVFSYDKIKGVPEAL